MDACALWCARSGGGVRTRVVDAERREDANVALREHLDDGRAERRLEGGDLLEERKGDDGLGHHGCDNWLDD